MTPTEIQHLILNGEKIDVEFKESKTALTKDVFDTACSFNNRNGGHILLGINDNKEITGINKQKAEKLLRNLQPPLITLKKYFLLCI